MFNRSNEMYKIVEIMRTNQTIYKLEEYEGNQIKSGFFTEKLQKMKHPDIFIIDKYY